MFKKCINGIKPPSVAAAEVDLKRMNSKCLPPFEVEGMMMFSYLCEVAKGKNLSLYTYVYAADEEMAQDMLDEQYEDFDFRMVLNEE